MRKPVGKKLRFEVFKRDSFTCQYCGSKAPDVILNVDHLNPVSKGGDNDILNLITSCGDCNSGKGATPLSDNSALEKQRTQLEELNERRQQLEMMIEWREHLRGFDEDQVEAFCSEFSKLCEGYGLNEGGRSLAAKWLKRFSFQELLAGLDGSVQSYLKRKSDGSVDPDCLGKVIEYVPRVAHCLKNGGHSDEDRQFFYIRGILRNRMHVNERVVMDLLRTAYVLGAEMDALMHFAKTARNWTAFRTGIQEFIEREREHEGASENVEM